MYVFGQIHLDENKFSSLSKQQYLDMSGLIYLRHEDFSLCKGNCTSHGNSPHSLVQLHLQGIANGKQYFVFKKGIFSFI